jgi:hypothetical protein
LQWTATEPEHVGGNYRIRVCSFLSCFHWTFLGLKSGTPCSPLKINRSFGRSSACYLLGLFCHVKDGSDMFLRNVDWLSTDYAVLHPRK